jgi:hypothetical protein
MPRTEYDPPAEKRCIPRHPWRWYSSRRAGYIRLKLAMLRGAFLASQRYLGCGGQGLGIRRRCLACLSSLSDAT